MSSPTPESANVFNQIGTAKYLHGLGRVADAEKIYREILASDGGNAEVIGLLAITARQQRNHKAAKKYWRQSLAAASPAWIFLRNLHNFLQALLEDGRWDEATKIADIDVPDWPAVRVPDSRERELLLTLARLLTVLGRVENASRLLETVAIALPKDPELLYELGRIQLHKGDAPAAFKTLSAAESAMLPTANLAVLSDLYMCAVSLGDGDAVQATREKIVEACPTFVSPPRAGQKANVLVLSSFPMVDQTIRSAKLLHFSGNYPSQLADALAEELRFSSVFVTHEAGRAASGTLPTPDLIINNNSNAERLVIDGGLPEQAEFADSFGVPVVNHPSTVLRMTRDGSAELLADIPDLVVPRTGRFSKADKTVGELIAEIEAQYDYPLITRTRVSQQGRGMVKVDNRDALRDALTNHTPDDFFVTAFVDSRGPTGFYRKLRAAVVGSEIIIVRVDHDTHWIVHGRKSEEVVAFYRSNPGLLVEGERICADPQRELGQPLMRSLEAIRARVSLDIFGVDFDVTSDGRLVFYEANATMNLLSTARPEIDYPRHAQERLLSAFRHFFQGLVGDRGGGSRIHH